MSVRDLDVFDYEYDDETGTVEVNTLGSIYGASIEDYPEVMSRVINILQEVPETSSVVLSESRDYEYGEDQVRMLRQVADAIQEISSQGYLTMPGGDNCDTVYSEYLPEVQREVVDRLRRDPIGAYVKLNRMERHIRERMDEAYPRQSRCLKYFVQDVIDPVMERLRETEMIDRAIEGDYITGHHVGDREVYREFFHPLVRPNFMLTKYMSLPPERGEEIDRYEIQNDVEVSIYEVPDQVQPVYHVNPPEFNLSEEKYTLLDAARRFMASHEPESGEFARPERMREVFQNIGRDMLRDIANQMDIQLSREELDNMTAILNRYTSGLGVLELLLSDPNIQDVYVNSPIGTDPIYVKHQDYEEAETNLIPTKEEAESWATRFRIQSGRPLDEANPVLDTDTEVPGGRARVAIIQENLSPEGLAFAFRRHRSRAWTLPLFIDNDMINPLGAALISFVVDGSRSVIFSGTRGAGKTSLLGASMLELMKKYRIVTIEDSVTGDSPVLYRVDGEVKYGEVEDLIDEQLERYGYREKAGREVLNANPEGVEVLSMDGEGNLDWSRAGLFMRHEVEKPIYEVETRTGRKLKVTEDHSIFGMGSDASIEEVKPTELEEGDHIVTPRKLPIPAEEKRINLLEKAEQLEGYFTGLEIGDKRSELKELAGKQGYSENTVGYWIRENILPAEVLADLEIGAADGIGYKHKAQSHSIPTEMELDERLMEFLGLWVADGCYDSSTNSVLVTLSDENCIEVLEEVADRLDIPVKHHSDGHTLMLHSKALKETMQLYGFEGGAHDKRLPEWIYSASDAQRRAFLRGLYSGDGYATADEIGVDLINEELVEDIQTLLLTEGIRGRARDSGKMRSMRISDLEGLRKFKKRIGFLQDYKSGKIDLEGKKSTHDTTDVVPVPRRLMEELCEREDNLQANDYIERGNQLGRQKLRSVTESSENEIVERLNHFAESDIFWDQVKSIEKVSEEETVYDISVPGDENFVAGGILAHNTLELPIPQMKDLGYNAERMKSRSVITQVENELPADEAIRTSLRLGDSALVIGEVRSDEARTLYEAMRVGAVANFVGGTIHGESAYAVFDRVVNDLGVPRTSFKATDLIVSANKIRSPDGLHTYRRVTGITEVRKDWNEDPQEEGAFVDLMRYDSNKDELVPTDTLLNGESMVLNRIAENIREWKNDWEAVWDNVQLRKQIKQELVERAQETGNRELLEAEFVTRANQRYHLLADQVSEEYGEQDPERIFARWKEWLDQQV